MQVNAFVIMMNSQRELAKKSLPDLIEEPYNNKLRLRNDIIKLLLEMNCQWKVVRYQCMTTILYRH